MGHMSVSDCEGKAMTESFDGCVGFTEVRYLMDEHSPFTFTGQSFASAGHSSISILYTGSDYPYFISEMKRFNVTSVESVTTLEEFAASQAKTSSTNAILD